MGNFIKEITDRTSLVASDRLWIEDSAVEQLKITAQLSGMVRAVGLPDLHPGRGYPVGAAFFTAGRIYPALVGNDIGCGVALWQTDLLKSKVKLDKLDRQIGNLDSAVEPDEWDELYARDESLEARVELVRSLLSKKGLDTSQLRSIGTIGGNHFVELQVVDRVDDQSLFEASGLTEKRLQLVVHSGSRGLGQDILRQHVDLFGHKGLAAQSPEANDYLEKHNAALDFASLNRDVIAARVLNRIRIDAFKILDVHHNTVLPTLLDGIQGWIHRKGANPTDEGLVMLPGSRDDFSYLISPVVDQSHLSAKSLPHGAGRKWQRTDCKGRLYHVASPEQLSRTKFGGRVICEDKALIYEEASQAYKSVDSVLDSLIGANLAKVIYRSRPVLTYKTRGECC